LKEVEDESQLSSVIMVGKMTDVKDRLELEDEFFCFGLVSFKRSGSVDLGFFGGSTG
jgi:hypothetical protein